MGLADGDPPTGVLVAHEQHEHAVVPFDHGGLVQRPGLVNEGLRVELPLRGLPPFIGAVTELPGLAVVVGVGDRGAHRQPVLVVVEVEGNDEASGVRAVPQGDAVTRAGSQEPHPRLLQLGIEVPRPAPREAVVVGVGDLQVAGGDGQEGLGRVRSGGELDVARRVAVTQHRAVVQHSELGGLAFERCHHAIGLDDVASVVEVSEQSPALLVESGGGPAVGLSDPSREVVDEDVDPSGARILDHAGVDDRRGVLPASRTVDDGARRFPAPSCVQGSAHDEVDVVGRVVGVGDPLVGPGQDGAGGQRQQGGDPVGGRAAVAAVEQGVGLDRLHLGQALDLRVAERVVVEPRSLDLSGQTHPLAVLADDDLIEPFDPCEEELARGVRLTEAVDVELDRAVPHRDHDLVPAAVTPGACGLDLPALSRGAHGRVGDPLGPHGHGELLAPVSAGGEEGSLLHPSPHPEAQPEGAVPHIGEAGDVMRTQPVGGDLDQGLGSLRQGKDLPGCQDPGVHREGCDLGTAPLPHDGLPQLGKVLEEGRGGTAEDLVAVEVEAGTGRADGDDGAVPAPVVERAHVLGLQLAPRAWNRRLVHERRSDDAQFKTDPVSSPQREEVTVGPRPELTGDASCFIAEDFCIKPQCGTD